ncbi:MAG: DNA mismatch repair endonuclease MutL [Candidatus Nitrospinota bacterium M3_3B_026]
MENTTCRASHESTVRVLSDGVANQIAAGEVVERPASIVKELLENSLDAGAGSLGVFLRNGGKSHIEVVDDGSGMGRDDALAAFERHATSKISGAEDLKAISTLGFRGEALPSIASVTRLSLTTCVADATSGVEVAVEGGRLLDVREAPPIPGTRVEARDLFFNTPARRKFLRSEAVEAGHIQEAVIRQALARPGAAFRLVRDGRPVMDAPAVSGEDALFDRIAALFGRGILSEITPVAHESSGMRLSGFISKPGLSRSRGRLQYIYVNGRYLRDRSIGRALVEGYRSLLPKGRSPVAFLFLEIPPERVDVNVHPAKTEARFADGWAVFRLVREGVFEALRGSRGGAGRAEPEPPAGEGAEKAVSEDGPWGVTAGPLRRRPSFREPVASLEREEAESPAVGGFPEGAVREAPDLFRSGPSSFSGVRAVGQIFDSFILVEEGGRLLLLDQHTAHERILYESLTRKYREGRVDAQELLFPVEVELSPRDAAHIKGRLDDLERLGIVLEEFGEGFFTLRRVPSILAGADLGAVVMEIAGRAALFDDGAGLDRLAEEAINIMACRGAVKAGQRLDKREITALVERLEGLDLPYTCPHGRPVALAVDREEILRMFMRK